MTERYFKFTCDEKAHNVDIFFKDVPASKWCLEIFIKRKLEEPDLEISFNQLYTDFMDSLDQMNQLNTVPISVRSLCTSYIHWLQVFLATSYTS